MKLKTRFTALVLCGALAVLPACESAVDTAPDQDVGERSMGRYVEELWELPVEPNWVVGPVLMPTGEIALLTSYGEDYDQYGFYFTTDGTNWREEKPGWLTELVEKGRIVFDFYFDSKGNGVALHQGMNEEEDYTYEVALIGSDGSLEHTKIGQMPRTSTASDAVFKIRESLKSGEEDAALPGPGENLQYHVEGEVDDLLQTALNSEEEGQEAQTEPEGETAAPAAVVVEEVDAATGQDAEDDGEDDEDSYFYTGMDSFYANRVYLGPDGLVYAQSFNNIEVYDPATGEFVREWDQGFSGVLVGDSLAQAVYTEFSHDSSITANSILLQDVEEKAAPRVVEAGMLTSYGSSDLLYGTEDGSLFVAVGSGIYRLTPGGQTWERMVDGDLSSLSLPSTDLSRMLAHGDGQYLVLVFADQNPVLYNYTYSSDTPTRPDTELVVYTLGNNKTLQQAAGTFRISNPNAVINIQTLLEDDSSATLDDAIRALNTELLSGKGPDLLVLDGMPLESYVEKGVLEDISDILSPMVEGGELLENIVGTFVDNGKYYAVPSRFALPSIWGEGEAVSAAGSLEDLKNYAASHPEQQLFYNMTPQYLLSRLAPVYQDRWLKDGQIDIQALGDFLDQVKQLSDAAKSTPEENDASFSHSWMKEQEELLEDVMGIGAGDVEIMIDYVQGFYSLMFPNGALFTRAGFSEELMSSEERAVIPDEMVDRSFRLLGEENGGYFVPQTVIGVNSAGNQKELAKEFVKTLLSPEVQNSDLEDGFPVNTKAIQAGIKRENDIYMSYVMVDDTGLYRTVVMGWPTEYLFQKVADTFPSLARPALVNDTLMEMILDESDPFFSGGRSAGEAAEAVAQRARILLAE